jgi:aryl sulfotransferase
VTQLTLLCSYPKSGNTWVRAVLDSVLRGGGPVDLNANLAGTALAAAREDFDRVMGVEASDLTEAEINQARPLHWSIMARGSAGSPLVKTHDARLSAQSGIAPVFSPDLIGAVIYVVRDPRDVAVSFAHHFATSIDEAITWMADPTTTLDSVRGRLPEHLPQLLSSWSRHVESWLDAPGLRRHLVHYEAMHADPQTAFAAVVDFLGWQVEAGVVARAVAAARFDALRAQEATVGFRERGTNMDRFFRRGAAGGWHDSLTSSQVERLCHDHGTVMERLGYLR